MGKIKQTPQRKRKTLSAVRVSSALLAALVLTAVSSDVGRSTLAYNSSYDEQISDLENEIKKLQYANEQRKNQIAGYNGNISENEDAVAMVSAQIDGVNDEILKYGQLITAKQNKITEKLLEIQSVEKTIAAKEQAIELKQQHIAEMEAQNKENLEKFSMLARALYMNDSSGTIPLLNGSDDWYSFFVYSDIVKNISSQNLEFMNNLLDNIHNQELLIVELNDEVKVLEDEKNKLEEEKQKLEAEMASLEDEKADLQKYVSQKIGELAELTAEIDSLKDKVNSLQLEIRESNEEMDRLNAELEQVIREKQAANANQPVYSTDGFRWPLETSFQLITTYFGYSAYHGGNHRGIDVGNAGIGGSNIYAAQSGTVIKVVNDCPHDFGKGYICCGGGYGNYIIVDHGGGISTLYAHCHSINVTEGAFVNKGDVIGTVGSTGWSTGNHLHLEVRVDGVAVNPLGYGYEYV